MGSFKSRCLSFLWHLEVLDILFRIRKVLLQEISKLWSLTRQTGYWKSDLSSKWRISSLCFQKVCDTVYATKKISTKIGLLTTDERQSMLFSATQTTKVTDLARISLRPGPIHIDVDKEESTSTVSTLSQGYVVCPPEHRFLLLFTFLKKNLKKKVIVFFSSCNSVKYHWELLNYIDVKNMYIYIYIYTTI